MPKKKDYWLVHTPNLYSSIGFILGRQLQLVAFISPKAQAKDDFFDRFREATGRNPYPNEPGLVFHPEGTDKYWHEERIIFNATERETLRLFLGDDLLRRGSDDTHWNINNNQLFFELLQLGFRPGNIQDLNIIKPNIPTNYLEAFMAGYDRALSQGMGKNNEPA